MRTVRHTAVRTLSRETSLGPEARRAAVDRAFARWAAPGPRAIAATNGSLARVTASAAAERMRDDDSPTAVSTDRIRTALRVELRRVATSKRVRVSQAAVEGAVSARRKMIERAAKDAAGNLTRTAIEGGTKGKLTGVPAGLPVSPTFSPWVATVNAWVIESRGAYGRFAVRTESGPATYIRDGTSVALDVDDDGIPEPVGRNERIEFSVRTVAVVAVPSGGLGVGDTDGNADERSVAWADPEPGPRCVTPTGECPRE